MSRKIRVLDRDGDMIPIRQVRLRQDIGLVGHQGRTMRIGVSPRGGVGMFAHALHPSVGIANDNGRKDVVRRQLGHVGIRAVQLAKGFVAHGCVFAPDDLPTNATLPWSKGGHAGRHVTIGNQQFGQQVGAGIKGTGNAQKVLGRTASALKACAGIEAVINGLIAV